ncbi:MAG TPA: TlpA family protein disulfide reductase [Hanamia sp.]|nr:TlpA family protein disulfide reductase [Hanamia sp.]
MEENKIVNWFKRNWKNYLFYAVILFFLFNASAKSWLLQRIMSTGLFNAKIKTEQTATISSAASFSVTAADGKIITSDSLKGKVVLINFWASWCPPCRAEMPSLNKLYNDLKDDDHFVFLFINEDEHIENAKNFISKNNYSIPLYFRLNVPTEIFSGTLPTTLVLNNQGKVVLKHEGMASYDSESFINQLKKLQ